MKWIVRLAFLFLMFYAWDIPVNLPLWRLILGALCLGFYTSADNIVSIWRLTRA